MTSDLYLNNKQDHPSPPYMSTKQKLSQWERNKYNKEKQQSHLVDKNVKLEVIDSSRSNNINNRKSYIRSGTPVRRKHCDESNTPTNHEKEHERISPMQSSIPRAPTPIFNRNQLSKRNPAIIMEAREANDNIIDNPNTNRPNTVPKPSLLSQSRRSSKIMISPNQSFLNEKHRPPTVTRLDPPAPPPCPPPSICRNKRSLKDLPRIPSNNSSDHNERTPASPNHSPPTKEQQPPPPPPMSPSSLNQRARQMSRPSLRKISNRGPFSVIRTSQSSDSHFKCSTSTASPKTSLDSENSHFQTSSQKIKNTSVTLSPYSSSSTYSSGSSCSSYNSSYEDELSDDDYENELCYENNNKPKQIQVEFSTVIDSTISPNKILSSPVKSWEKCIGKGSYLASSNSGNSECTDDDSTFYDCPSPGRFREENDNEFSNKKIAKQNEEENELIKMFLGSEDDNESYQTCESENSQFGDFEQSNPCDDPVFDENNPWNLYLTTMSDSTKDNESNKNKLSLAVIENGDKNKNEIKSPISSKNTGQGYGQEISRHVEVDSRQTSLSPTYAKNLLIEGDDESDNKSSNPNKSLNALKDKGRMDAELIDKNANLDFRTSKDKQILNNEPLQIDQNRSEPISQEYVDKLARLVHIYREEHKAARFLVGTLKLEKQDIQMKLNEVIDKFLQRQNHFYTTSLENTKLKATQRDLQKAIKKMRGQLTNEFASAVEKNKKMKKELYEEKRRSKKLEAEIKRLKSKISK